MAIHRMIQRYSRSFFIFISIVAGWLLVTGLAGGIPASGVQATPDSSSLMFPPIKGGLIYTDMPANATQVDYGKEAYRLVCSACHGDKGQGLTADWLATWAPEDQNCWKAKCHGGMHPPDGFKLPGYVPPIFGRNHLTRFHTALDLKNYIQKYMPWHDPGYLKPEEYLSITAYMLRTSGIDPMQQPLTPELAAAIVINPDSGVPTPVSKVVPRNTNSFINNTSVFLIGIGILVVILLGLGVLLRLIFRKGA